LSIRSLAALAVARDKAAPDQPAGGGAGQAALVQTDGTVAAQPAGQPPAQGGVPQRFADVLISAIPTEPLAAYTALIGIAAGGIDVAHPRAYLAFRWWVYGAFLALTLVAVWVAYYRASRGPAGTNDQSNRRSFPWAEAAAALTAAATWGLAMPNSPLNVQVSGTARTLASASIAIAGASVLSLVFAPQLKTGTNSPGE
jgi:hypothetical protein